MEQLITVFGKTVEIGVREECFGNASGREVLSLQEAYMYARDLGEMLERFGDVLWWPLKGLISFFSVSLSSSCRHRWREGDMFS